MHLPRLCRCKRDGRRASYADAAHIAQQRSAGEPTKAVKERAQRRKGHHLLIRRSATWPAMNLKVLLSAVVSAA